MIAKNPIKLEITADDRKGIIGGSSVGAVLGLPGYVSQYDVWRDYVGIRRPVSADLAWTYLKGHIFEKTIAELFTAKTGIDVEEVPFAYADPDHPYLICHPDRAFIKPIDGKRYALECKMASMHAVRKSWPDTEDGDRIPMPFLPSDVAVYDGTELLPPQYLAQCYWYMAICGYDGVFLARLSDTDLTIYWVGPDESRERGIYDAVIDFRERVESGWIPPMTREDEASEMYPVADDSDAVTADDQTQDAVKELRKLNDSRKELDERIEALRLKIKGFMGTAGVLEDDRGDRIATWRNSRSGRLDAERLRIEKPEIYEEYLKETQGRIFRIMPEVTLESMGLPRF